MPCRHKAEQAQKYTNLVYNEIFLSYVLQSSFDGCAVLDVAAKLASAGIVEYWAKINDILLFTKTSDSDRLDIFSKVSIQGVFYLIENWT